MTRRLLLAALSASLPTALFAEDNRPAVRIVQVRADEVVRGQIPESAPKPMPTLPAPQPFAAGPGVTESRTLPPPAIPGAAPMYVSAGGPVGGVTMGPAMPVGAPMGDAGLFPTPQPDAPIFAPGSPFTLHSPNSSTNKFWVTGEYLYWWTEAPSIPALVTTGPRASNGILGAPGTTILLGDGDFEDTGHSGGRFNVGYWFGNQQCWAIDFGYFFIDQDGETFSTNSTAFPVLARPFTNLNQNIQFSQLVASPSLATGGVSVATESELWGVDANLRRKICCWSTPCFRSDFIFGFRHLNYTESLTITETFARTPNSPPSIGVPNATGGTVVDSFSTENEFYGGQFGVAHELRRGRWFLNGMWKVGLGEMQQSVTINGSQNLTLAGGATSTATGGLLALPGANIGTFSQNEFCVVPEIGINLGYHLTPHLRIFVGYNFLYMSSVLRPGDQIDTGLDVTRIPNFPVAGAVPLTTVRPTVPLKDTSFYAQGINFGLSFTW